MAMDAPDKNTKVGAQSVPSSGEKDGEVADRGLSERSCARPRERNHAHGPRP